MAMTEHAMTTSGGAQKVLTVERRFRRITLLVFVVAALAVAGLEWYHEGEDRRRNETVDDLADALDNTQAAIDQAERNRKEIQKLREEAELMRIDAAAANSLIVRLLTENDAARRRALVEEFNQRQIERAQRPIPTTTTTSPPTRHRADPEPGSGSPGSTAPPTTSPPATTTTRPLVSGIGPLPPITQPTIPRLVTFAYD